MPVGRELLFEVKSYLGTYPVYFSESFSKEALSDLASPDNYYFIDQVFYDLHRDALQNVVVADRTVFFDATEQNKSYTAVESVIEKFVKLKLKKSHRLVVMGGGVTQDVGGFISHIYKRGIPWVLFPTTLLAQADSCIGSKNSINLTAIKNQIGTFYPPAQVHVVYSALKTLKEEEILSGIGEILKLALIESPETLSYVRGRLELLSKDAGIFKEVLDRVLRIKKRYIEEDEFDTNVRHILNYGHTFGHAFESATQFAIPHGIAVTLGVLAATFFAEQLDLIPEGETSELRSWLTPYFHPYENILKQQSWDSLVELMKSDKKNVGGDIRFILPHDQVAGNLKHFRLSPEKAGEILQQFLNVV